MTEYIEPTPEQEAANIIRDIFLSDRHKGVISNEKVKELINNKRYYGPYGRLSGAAKDTLKKAFGELIGENYIEKKGKNWIWVSSKWTLDDPVKESSMSTEGTIWLQVPGTADYEGYDDVEAAGYALGQRLGLRPFVKFKHISGIMRKAKVSDHGLSVEYSPAKIYFSGRDHIAAYEGDSEGEWLGPLSPEMWDDFLAAMERGLAFSTHYGE